MFQGIRLMPLSLAVTVPELTQDTIVWIGCNNPTKAETVQTVYGNNNYNNDYTFIRRMEIAAITKVHILGR